MMGSAGRPLLNSVALERLDAPRSCNRAQCPAWCSPAASVDGMPSNADERVRNVGEIVEAALSRGIEKSDIFVDGRRVPYLGIRRIRVALP